MTAYFISSEIYRETGYGPNHPDPETGEVIAGTAYLYGAGLETLTAYGRDIIRLLNDDLTEEDIQNGAHVRAWIDRMNAPESITGADHVIDIDGSDAERFGSAMDFSWADGGHDHARGNPANPGELVARVSESFETLATAGAFGNASSSCGYLGISVENAGLKLWMLSQPGTLSQSVCTPPVDCGPHSRMCPTRLPAASRS